MSDTALVVALGRVETDALQELHRRHGGAVFGIARRVLRDRSLAEDVVQDVFLRLWNEPDRFDPDRGGVRAFLVTKAHGRAVEIVRSEEARRTRQDRHGASVTDPSFDLEREVWDRFLAAEVRDALADLDHEQRTCIELAYFGGYSYREVARLLDLPEGTVKSRIRTGLHRLRDRLESQGVLR